MCKRVLEVEYFIKSMMYQMLKKRKKKFLQRALFAKGNQKLLDISFGIALIRIHFGNVLNHIILGCENN